MEPFGAPLNYRLFCCFCRLSFALNAISGQSGVGLVPSDIGKCLVSRERKYIIKLSFGGNHREKQDPSSIFKYYFDRTFDRNL